MLQEVNILIQYEFCVTTNYPSAILMHLPSTKCVDLATSELLTVILILQYGSHSVTNLLPVSGLTTSEI